MKLKRREHWQTREYREFLRARATVAFSWGVNDCALFVADGVQAITGVDPCPEVRGQYRSAKGALRVMRQHAGSNDIAVVVAWFAERCGMRKREFPLTAQRGDVVLIEDGGRLIAALIGLSGRVALAPGDGGLRSFPLMQVRAAWFY